MPPPLDQIFPPCPDFTEKDASDQGGRVFLVTGSTSGIGLELAKMLYRLNGTVYIAARSLPKINAAIETIRSQVETGSGRLEALQIDLANLSSIEESVGNFISREDRLDVLVHNAGLMTPPSGSKTSLGHDLEMGTNCLGPFLLNHYLEPTLRRTAAQKHNALGVRIVWVSSLIATSVPRGGITMNGDGTPRVIKNAMENYMQSKVGNVFLAKESARRLHQAGIFSVSVNPGLLKTELQRHLPSLQRMVMGLMFKEAKFGAYTELFAILSPEITNQEASPFIIPWGRFGQIPNHIAESIEKGKAASFYQWCDRETKAYQ